MCVLFNISFTTIENHCEVEITNSHLASELSNKTRWTSQFQIMKRYLKIKASIRKIEDIDLHMPNTAMRRHPVEGQTHFQNF